MSGKDKLIQQLKKQVFKYKEQAIFWENKYNQLKVQYDQHIQSINNNNNNNNNTNQDNKIQKRIQQSSISLLQDINFNQNLSQAFSLINKINENIHKPQQNLIIFNKKISQSNLQYNQDEDDENQFSEQTSPTYRSPRVFYDGKEEDEEVDFFSMEQIEKHARSSFKNKSEKVQDQLQVERQNNSTETQKAPSGLQLIESYFILQKINDIKQFLKTPALWIRSGNSQLLQKQKNLLQIIYRYSFRQQLLQPIQDDPFDSRLNEIKYGTPYQDLVYSFDNFSVQGGGEEEEECKIMNKSMRKRYIFCLIRPELIYVEGKPFETEILYAFISPFPFKQFFQDLHRTIQQQIKFQLLTSQKSIYQQQIQITKQRRISILSNMMKEIYEYCLQRCSRINSYPINLEIRTKVGKLKIDIQSENEMKRMERESLLGLVRKYNLMKISKILHYVMAEKQVVVVALTRKALNQVLEIVRMMIKPFYWVFPVVYRYSCHFQPFMLSPMPLIIGITFDFLSCNSKENPILVNNDFVTIFVDERINSSNNQTKQNRDFFDFFSSNKSKYIANDLREIPSYEKDIQTLYKYLSKNDKKSKSTLSQRLYKYVNRLKNFVISGQVKDQITPFFIDFMDTQMVQYFKDVLQGGSNKKITKNKQQQDYNEDLTMTR